MKRTILYLCLVVFIIPARAQSKWQPITLNANQASYSEGWSLDGCQVFLLKDGNGIVIETEQGFANGYKYRMHTAADGSYPPATIIQHIKITGVEGKTDMHMEWEFSSPIIDFITPYQTGPDLFYFLYANDARSLPPNIRKQFHRLYGIEP